jgi:integrase
MAASGKLSAMAVTKQTKVGRYGDGGGLWLQVSIYGTKSWVFRFTVAGKPRTFGLGSLQDVTLAEARDAAREARRQVREGIDPIEARKAKLAEARASAVAGVTFDEAAKRYIASHEAGWRNEKHIAQWRATLDTYASPIFGSLDIAAIDTGLVVKVLEPIWTTKPETAARLRGRIESVLGWAAVRGYRASGDNPARWRGHLDKLLPARSKVRKVKHHEALPIDDVPGFMSELRARAVISARALEFTISTVARTGEVIGAKWDEIDIANKLWTVPATRMKAGKEHRVPLTPAAIKLLEALPREDGNDFVFVGGRKGSGLSNMAMLQLIRGMRPDDKLTVHGFRSTFRDWAAERTSFPSDIVEMALAHTIENKVEAAYRRGDLLEKRRNLAEAWSGYCASPARDKASNVSPIRGVAHG